MCRWSDQSGKPCKSWEKYILRKGDKIDLPLRWNEMETSGLVGKRFGCAFFLRSAKIFSVREKRSSSRLDSAMRNILSHALRFCVLTAIAAFARSIMAEESATSLSRVSIPYRAENLDALRRGFAQPPQGAGPWVYWFWWDNAVTKEEITRELEEMATAGFAGAEIRCVDALWLREQFKVELPRTGHKPLAYLSPEFLECLEHACATAKRLGLNPGMGWPPGGTWITPQYQSRMLLSESVLAEGGRLLEISVPQKIAQAEMVFAWRLAPNQEKQVEPDSFIDLSGSLTGEKRKLIWQAPAGRWLIGFFRTGFGGPLDKATGYPPDPGSAEAMRFHLEYFFTRLDPVLQKYYGTTLTDLASDSWEYDGRPFWTPEIFRAFEPVAGRPLRPAMYALLDYGPDAERIRDQVSRAENELVRRNYFGLLAEFAHQRGLRSRPQPYGRGLHRDLFASYDNCDIPEVEQGVFPAVAVWIAHVTGKPLITMEACTFLSHDNVELGDFGKSFGPWQINPDLLRRHANLDFARGINRIQMHSFGYSPPGIDLPGWRMYAEIPLNRNVIWWPYLRLLNKWIARNQLVLQSGIPVADAVIYPVEGNPPEKIAKISTDTEPATAMNSIDALSRPFFSRLKKNRKHPISKTSC